MMEDLFGYKPMIGHNLLPQDGLVAYFGPVFTVSEADELVGRLLAEIEWRNDQAVVFGKTILTRRQVAWYADQPYAYTYSGVTKRALAWTDLLKAINLKIAVLCQESFNSCLLNLYPSGQDGMAWHSDAEKELKRHGVIASVSFGTARRFQFRHKKTEALVSLWLEHGSLLVMKGETQSYWLHRLPKMARVDSPRINLTFRQMNH